MVFGGGQPNCVVGMLSGAGRLRAKMGGVEDLGSKTDFPLRRLRVYGALKIGGEAGLRTKSKSAWFEPPFGGPP